MSALQQSLVDQPDYETQIAMILQNRYGDGTVYLPRHKSSAFYAEAKQQAYIDADGYITRKGRALIAKHTFL